MRRTFRRHLKERTVMFHNISCVLSFTSVIDIFKSREQCHMSGYTDNTSCVSITASSTHRLVSFQPMHIPDTVPSKFSYWCVSSISLEWLLAGRVVWTSWVYSLLLALGPHRLLSTYFEGFGVASSIVQGCGHAETASPLVIIPVSPSADPRQQASVGFAYKRHSLMVKASCLIPWLTGSSESLLKCIHTHQKAGHKM